MVSVNHERRYDNVWVVITAVITCLLLSWCKPYIYADERDLEQDSQTVDGSNREVLPSGAHYWEPVPGVQEAVEQS